MATPTKLFEPAIVRWAAAAAFRKLDPRVQVRNPVMFVVLVGSILTTLIWVRDLVLRPAGAAAIHGVRWFPSRPPVVGLDYEMDLRGVAREIWI